MKLLQGFVFGIVTFLIILWYAWQLIETLLSGSWGWFGLQVSVVGVVWSFVLAWLLKRNQTT